MKISPKNKKAYQKGIEDRTAGVPFAQNYYLHLRTLVCSFYWDVGWNEQDKAIEEILNNK